MIAAFAAPLIASKLAEPDNIIIDAKSGVSGAGRGGGSTFGYAEVNEDVAAYGLLKHAHVPEMNSALSEISGKSVALRILAERLRARQQHRQEMMAQVGGAHARRRRADADRGDDLFVAVGHGHRERERGGARSADGGSQGGPGPERARASG